MTQEEFSKEFELNRLKLKSFILRITASIEDSEDLVQDTFIKASEKLESYRAESSLKTWIFSIASNLAKDNLRAKKRWPETVSDICKTEAISNPDYFPEAFKIQSSSLHGQFEIKEHISFCLVCISKSLPLEQQISIFLKEVYDFKISEIMEIMGITEAMVKYYLHNGRTKLTQIFDNRCALIKKEGICHQCSELNGIFNPKQNFEIEKNKIEMVRLAEKGDKEELLDLRLKLLKEIDPFTSKGSDLQLFHLEHNKRVMENFSELN